MGRVPRPVHEVDHDALIPLTDRVQEHHLSEPLFDGVGSPGAVGMVLMSNGPDRAPTWGGGSGRAGGGGGGGGIAPGAVIPIVKQGATGGGDEYAFDLLTLTDLP